MDNAERAGYQRGADAMRKTIADRDAYIVRHRQVISRLLRHFKGREPVSALFSAALEDAENILNEKKR